MIQESDAEKALIAIYGKEELEEEYGSFCKPDEGLYRELCEEALELVLEEK